MVQYLPTYVAPPTFAPLPYGLMSVAQMPGGDSDQVHWKLGVQFQPDSCDDALTTVANCPFTNLDDFTKDVTSEGVPAKGGTAFTVYADIECTPVGNFWQEAEARARAALTNNEPRAVEATFWTGEITTGPAGETVYPHLAATTEVYGNGNDVLLQPAATVLVTGAVDITTAVGMLEGALADCYGGVGALHAPREVLAHMANAYLLKQVGPQLRTYGDIPIAFGAGYPGTSPAGVTPPTNTVWMYATGAVMLRRGNIVITSDRTQALDRSVNTERLFAERTYQISWDCCLFAVPVSLA